MEGQLQTSTNLQQQVNQQNLQKAIEERLKQQQNIMREQQQMQNSQPQQETPQFYPPHNNKFNIFVLISFWFTILLMIYILFLVMIPDKQRDQQDYWGKIEAILRDLKDLYKYQKREL